MVKDKRNSRTLQYRPTDTVVRQSNKNVVKFLEKLVTEL